MLRSHLEGFENFILEYNKLCTGEHPCFNGKSGNPLIRFDGSKATKDMRIKASNQGTLCKQTESLADIRLAQGSVKSVNSQMSLELEYGNEVTLI